MFLIVVAMCFNLGKEVVCNELYRSQQLPLSDCLQAIAVVQKNQPRRAITYCTEASYGNS